MDGQQNGEVVTQLLEREILRVQRGGRPPGKDSRLLDVYNERPVRVTAKVSVPVREHPKFNFVGKLLGPRGSSLKQLQKETMTKMAVLGRGSMKNKQQEEELRDSSDPKHAHLKEDLHVEITAFASPAEAYARMAFALTEVRKYLIPDSNDQIRQRQMREIQEMKKMRDTTVARMQGDPLVTFPEDSGHETDPSGSPQSDVEGDSKSVGYTDCSRDYLSDIKIQTVMDRLRHSWAPQEVFPHPQESCHTLPPRNILNKMLSLHYKHKTEREVELGPQPCECLPHKRKLIEIETGRNPAKKSKDVDR